MNTSRRFYVYAYIDPRTNEPFYIGKGCGGRARSHTLPCNLKAYDSFFYRKLRKMLDGGTDPDVEIIKDNLTEEESLASEASLILLVGMRRHGAGPLCNTYVGDYRGIPGDRKGHPIEMWGESFPSLTLVVADPRCKVSFPLFRARVVDRGWEPELAAAVPPTPPGKPVYCWGTVFPSMMAVAQDERCEVSLTQLDRRLKAGWSISVAASTPPIKPTPAPWNRW